MTNVAQMKFRYFSPVLGRVVQRPGTDTYIGASRRPGGFVVNPAAVVAIPESEIIGRTKTWNNLVKRGDLIAVTEQAYIAWQEARTRKGEAAKAARAAKQQEQQKSAKPAGGADDQAGDSNAQPSAPPSNEPPSLKQSGGKKKGGGKGRR